jgi:hypothetical protein
MTEGPVTVFTTSDPGALAFAQSLLEAADIEFIVVGENQRIVPPYTGFAELRVAAADAEAARALLADIA